MIRNLITAGLIGSIIILLAALLKVCAQRDQMSDAIRYVHDHGYPEVYDRYYEIGGDTIMLQRWVFSY